MKCVVDITEKGLATSKFSIHVEMIDRAVSEIFCTIVH